MVAAAQAPDHRAVTFAGLLGEGDVADVYLAHKPGGPPCVVKFARGPEGNTLLDNERRVLAHLSTAANDTTYRRYLPTLVESFSVACKRVNVFLHEPGFYTLEQVHGRHPALDGRHLGWIFNRLLTVLGFCHAHGTLHGAVLPCHVLLHPEGHGLRLVGWGQSVANGRPVSALSARYCDWYPPEVSKKQPASQSTDLFLAARCLSYLAGGDPAKGRMPEAVPEPMRRFVGTCLLPGPRMRPGDAWQLQQEFGELLCRLYGPPKFHELKM
jgi:serine/threonine protein kinase